MRVLLFADGKVPWLPDPTVAVGINVGQGIGTHVGQVEAVRSGGTIAELAAAGVQADQGFGIRITAAELS